MFRIHQTIFIRYKISTYCIEQENQIIVTPIEIKEETTALSQTIDPKREFIKKFMEVCEQVFNTKLYKRAKPALENVADKLYSIFFS